MRKTKKKKSDVQRLTAKIENPDYIICTDGGCAFNPGGAGGIGVIITRVSDGNRTEISAGYTSTTNNRMEIRAVMAALEAVPGACAIRLFSDSHYTLNCMAGIWEKKKNLDLWAQLERLCTGKEIELNWVKGHNNHPDNERCDELATQGIQSPDKIPDVGYSPEPDTGRTAEQGRIAEQHACIRQPEKPGNTPPPPTARQTTQRWEAEPAPVSARTAQTGSVPSSMHVDIEIPAELQDHNPGMMSPAEYAAHYHVNSICAQGICTFYVKGIRNFKAYNSIKTGGVDEHSYKGLNTIAGNSPNPALFISTLQKYLPDMKDASSAARWHDRGLSIRDSIRKALVDAEVRANCLNNRKNS